MHLTWRKHHPAKGPCSSLVTWHVCKASPSRAGPSEALQRSSWQDNHRDGLTQGAGGLTHSRQKNASSKQGKWRALKQTAWLTLSRARSLRIGAASSLVKREWRNLDGYKTRHPFLTGFPGLDWYFLSLASSCSSNWDKAYKGQCWRKTSALDWPRKATPQQHLLPLAHSTAPDCSELNPTSLLLLAEIRPSLL